LCYGLVNSKEAVYILENKEGWVDKSSEAKQGEGFGFKLALKNNLRIH